MCIMARRTVWFRTRPVMFGYRRFAQPLGGHVIKSPQVQARGFYIGRPPKVSHMIYRPGAPINEYIIIQEVSAPETHDISPDTGSPHNIPRGVSTKHFAPFIYNDCCMEWVPAGPTQVEPLGPETVIKAVSWNLKCKNAEARLRTTTAIDYLKRKFGTTPKDLVIMLQELNLKALGVLMKHSWVRKNFLLSDVQHPGDSVDQVDFMGDSFIARDVEVEHNGSACFTMMLISRSLPTRNCFRVPLRACPHKDILITDIDHSQVGPTGSRDFVQLCTAELDELPLFKSNDDRSSHRLSQLSQISEVLKGRDLTQPDDPQVVQGLAGITNYAIGRPQPHLQPSHKDGSVGLVDVGETWCDPKDREVALRRMDRWLHTMGPAFKVHLLDSKHRDGDQGRLASRLKTRETEVWERKPKPLRRWEKCWKLKRSHWKLVAEMGIRWRLCPDEVDGALMAMLSDTHCMYRKQTMKLPVSENCAIIAEIRVGSHHV